MRPTYNRQPWAVVQASTQARVRSPPLPFAGTVVAVVSLTNATSFSSQSRKSTGFPDRWSSVCAVSLSLSRIHADSDIPASAAAFLNAAFSFALMRICTGVAFASALAKRGRPTPATEREGNHAGGRIVHPGDDGDRRQRCVVQRNAGYRVGASGWQSARSVRTAIHEASACMEQLHETPAKRVPAATCERFLKLVPFGAMTLSPDNFPDWFLPRLVLALVMLAVFAVVRWVAQ